MLYIVCTTVCCAGSFYFAVNVAKRYVPQLKHKSRHTAVQPLRAQLTWCQRALRLRQSSQVRSTVAAAAAAAATQVVQQQA
jgi:hypothetical protein